MICKNKIENVDCELKIELDVHYSKLYLNGSLFLINDVDLAQVIRAVVNSTTVDEFKASITGIWGEDKILSSLKNHSLLIGGH